MRIQSLAGKWRFRWAGSSGGDGLQDSARAVGKLREWSPCQVPGSVHTDLLALGHMPDPFVADNELKVQWVAECDWEYRRTFPLSPELRAEDRVFLVCDGLDTLADLALNGQALGQAENMFRSYRWDVTSLLEEGENELRIAFPSPMAYIRPRQAKRPLWSPSQSIPGGPYLRKAPCQFGWDWGPRLPPVGIWKGIRLEGCSVARLDNVHLRQLHVAGAVTVKAGVTLERWLDDDLRAVLHLTAPDGHTQEAEAVLKNGAITDTLEIEITDPQLWWPNGHGDRPLYRVEVGLYRAGALLDSRTFQMGLRTLELRQEQDEFGKSFTFVVNDVPIFAKGANWIPADSFPTRITNAHLEYLVRSAAEANMNMLRVWGGGFYEEERFYDLCDRYGILVWQDFAFACSVYPDDEEFCENVRVEAVQNVRRLRHRASLALWCGNNEMEWGWDEKNDESLERAYVRMFHRLLPQTCSSEDPDHAYWPSSPSSNTLFQNPNGQEQGDMHYWGVWHGREPFAAYLDLYPRFMSEFGFQSLPPLETVRTYADEADWNMTSYIMEHHQRSEKGNGLIIAQMTDRFRMPKDFASLVYLSMVLQAEAIRIGVEHWRRNMHRVGGALYWQLNDCWPVASWSSIDYYGRWKALHYVAKRFFAPVLLSAEDGADGALSLHVTSDLMTPWDGTVRWTLEDLCGGVLLSGEEGVRVAPRSSTRVCELDFTGRLTDVKKRDTVLVFESWSGDRRQELGVLSFVPDKHLSLEDPRLGVEVLELGDRLIFEVRAESLARFVELSLIGADVIFSDNYFDLPAGRTVTVSCRAPEGWTSKRARAALSVRSLYDSYS